MNNKIKKILETEISNEENEIMNLLEIEKNIDNNFWVGSKNEWIKKLPSTGKGNLGENITKNILNKLNIKCVIPKNRRGDFDLEMVLPNGTMLLCENKLATLDINGSFQFNGVKINRKYDLIFAIGVTPYCIYYKIIFFKELNEGKYTFCSMTRKNNDEDKYSLSYKLMIPFDKMDNFVNFNEKIINKLSNRI